MAPELKSETVANIMILLEQQDLSALDEFDEQRESFRDALGNEQFDKLQGYLAKLDYKEAINILSSLKT